MFEVTDSDYSFIYSFIFYELSNKKLYLFVTFSFHAIVVGPCHHGMARPQVADRGTASNMEGSCE